MLIQAMQMLHRALISEQIDAKDIKISVGSNDAWGRILWLMQRNAHHLRFEGDTTRLTIADIELTYQGELSPRIDLEMIKQMVSPGGLCAAPPPRAIYNPADGSIRGLSEEEEEAVRLGTFTTSEPVSIGELSTKILKDVERKRAEKPYADAFDIAKSMIEGGETGG